MIIQTTHVRDLEYQANIEALKLPEHRREIIALGFIAVNGDIDLDSDETIVWHGLANRASEPWHRFDVNGEDIEAMVALEMHHGRGPYALWHSHYVAEGPSKSDLEMYPGWLIEHGRVYHAPTRRTVFYNEDGILHVNSNLESVESTTTRTTAG